MFVSALKEEVEGMISLDTKELCDGIIRSLRMEISSTERSNYYNKYIRKLRLEIDEDGIMRIKIMAVKSISIRIDEEMLNKLHVVADYEGRTANSQILILIRDAIEKYEEKHGKIEI